MHISKILLFGIFLLIIDSKTCLGLLYLAFLILILIIEKENRWSASWIPIYFYSLIIIISQYLLQLKISQNFLQDLMNWGGFSFEKDAILTNFVTNCLIQFLCILQRTSQRWNPLILSESKFLSFYARNTQIAKDFKIVKKKVQKYRENLNKIPKFPEEDQEEDEKEPLLPGKDSKNEPISIELGVGDAANFEEFKKFQNYIMKKPIMDGNWLSLRLEYGYQHIGFEFALLFLVGAAFYKLNAISIVYILLAAYFSFHCKYLTLEDNFSERKIKSLIHKWRLVYFLISLGLLFQYAILLWFPLNWNVFYPWKDVLFLCEEESKNSFSKVAEFHDESDLVKCLNNWKKWFFLERFKDNELFMDFLVLFMMILYENYFFWNKENNKISKVCPIKAKDEKDFTYKRVNWLDWIKFFYYCYFYKLALIIFFIAGAIDNLSGSTDIISGVYLMISMYLHYNSNKLNHQRNRIWKRVEAFNSIVMILYIIFQSPVFPCPVIQEDRYYFTSEECLSIQSTQKGFFIWKHKENAPESLAVIYVLFCQTLGLNKISSNYFSDITKPVFAVIFFLMGLLQRQIFNHPITNEYVAAFLKREREDSVKRAIIYIENNHLIRFWSYENLKTQKEVYLSLQKRVDRKIKQWEDLLAIKTAEKMRIEPEVIEKKGKIEDEIDVYSEEMRVKAERVCYDKELPTLTLREVLDILEKAEGDEKKAEILIKLKKFDKKKITIESIYSSKAINLTAYWPERLELLTNEEESLHAHIKALEEELLKESSSSEIGKKEIDIVDKEKESSLYKKPWYKSIYKEIKAIFRSISQGLKAFLLNFTHQTFFAGSKQRLEDDPLIIILAYFIISQMDKICYLLMIINHIVNDNILSLVFPISLFLYALLENPIPLKGYWKFIVFYTVLIIMVKFLYQLPIFCGTPPLSFFFYTGESACSSRSFSEAELVSRIDYIIGIHKFAGSASYPKNQGFFLGVLCDYLVLLFLLLHRFLQEKLGFWFHVKIEKSLFEIPQFYKKEDLALKLAGNKHLDLESNPIEIEDHSTRSYGDIIDKRLELLEKEKLGVFERCMEGMKMFGLRVVPNFLPKEHEIEVMKERRLYERKKMQTLPSLIKPGKDYYSPAFAVCLIILAYFIVFYQKMVGRKESISETLDNNSQFSGDLVLAIIFILGWIILDRIIYNMNKSSLEQKEKPYDYGKTAMLMKIVIHVFIIILIHYYLCFRLPLSGKTFFCNSPSLVICYLFFAWYLYYSSFQIKFGYPEADTTQIFTTNTDVFTRTAFKVYRAIPFLTELKAILDWTVIRTSLDLFQWIKLDDAYANLYNCKAEMAVRKENKQGTPRHFWEKCSNGCILVVLLLVIIIGPILIFSTLNPILETNNVNSGIISIELVVSPKITENSTDHFSNVFELYRVENLEIKGFSGDDFSLLTHSFYGIDQDSQSRAQKVTLMAYSEKNWEISKPRLKDLEKLLNDDKNRVYITGKWSFMRSHPPGNEMAKGSNTIVLNENGKKKLKNSIAGNSSEEDSIDLISKFFNF